MGVREKLWSRKIIKVVQEPGTSTLAILRLPLEPRLAVIYEDRPWDKPQPIRVSGPLAYHVIDQGSIRTVVQFHAALRYSYIRGSPVGAI